MLTVTLQVVSSSIHVPLYWYIISKGALNIMTISKSNQLPCVQSYDTFNFSMIGSIRSNFGLFPGSAFQQISMIL